jgi:hypothetical protein
VGQDNPIRVSIIGADENDHLIPELASSERWTRETRGEGSQPSFAVPTGQELTRLSHAISDAAYNNNKRIMSKVLTNIMSDLAQCYFGPAPPLRLPEALRQPTSIVVHPSRLSDLRSFLKDGKAFFRYPEQAKLVEKMQARQNHILAVLPAGAGKMFLVMMQAKMYHSHLMTMMVLPLLGLHQDLERRAREHEVSIARWMLGEKFNPDIMMIFVSVEHAGFEEFLMYVMNIPGRLLILTTTPTGTLWNSIIVALDQLYIQVLSSSHVNIDELRLVLGAIIFLRFPLRLRELGHLLKMAIDRLQIVLEGLHSVLSIPEDYEAGPVTPAHLSLQEFLTSRDRAGGFFVDPSLKNMELAKCCLTRIRTLPKYTFSYPSNPRLCWNAVMMYVRQDDMAGRLTTRYACRYWSSHLVESSPTDDDLMGLMKDFCIHYALPWRMFTEIDTQYGGIAHQELAHAQELAQTQAALQRAMQGAKHRNILVTYLSAGMFVIILATYAACSQATSFICFVPHFRSLWFCECSRLLGIGCLHPITLGGDGVHVFDVFLCQLPGSRSISSGLG